MTSHKQEREALLASASAAQINGVKDDAQSVVFEINSYLLDHCPDGQHWEDFDPDIDGARQVLIDMFDL